MKFPRWAIALIMYVIIITIIVLVKPALMFDADGTIKHAGTGLVYGSSPFAPAISFPLIAFVCYMVTCSVYNLRIIKVQPM